MRVFATFLACLFGGGVIALASGGSKPETKAEAAPPPAPEEKKEPEEFTFVPDPAAEARRERMRELGKRGGKKRVENLKKKKESENVI